MVMPPTQYLSNLKDAFANAHGYKKDDRPLAERRKRDKVECQYCGRMNVSDPGRTKKVCQYCLSKLDSSREARDAKDNAGSWVHYQLGDSTASSFTVTSDWDTV